MRPIIDALPHEHCGGGGTVAFPNRRSDFHKCLIRQPFTRCFGFASSGGHAKSRIIERFLLEPAARYGAVRDMHLKMQVAVARGLRCGS